MSWLDTSHEQPRWELRTVDLVRGAHRREPDVLSKAAAHGLLAPLPNGDYVALHEGQLTRFGPDAVVRWQVSEARTNNLLHVDARELGTAAFVSGLKLLIAAPLDAKPHRLDRVQGEPFVAVSHAGTHVFIVDDHSARLLEVATATRQFTLARAALDELTIDTIDRVFFDDAGHPHVEAGGHSYRVGADNEVLATPTLTPSAASLTAVVGFDEIIRLIDVTGDSVLRIHLSPNGKAGVVEDGQAIDWLGAPAQAKTCRTILVKGEVIRGKALEPLRRARLYARALEDS
jgi:hypothetical protein